MKLFITGISGLLGLNTALQSKDRFTVSGCYYGAPVSLMGVKTLQLDLRCLDAVLEVLRTVEPDVIFHTAGLTNVEECEANPALAQRLNEESASHVALAAATLGIKLVHMSTDHLFDGVKPWKSETEPPAPLNIYAATKWQAERAVLRACPDALIIRTNFFGWGTSSRTSFSDWILGELRQAKTLTMFSDVFFTPILINDLVDVVSELIEQKAAGVHNVAGAERLSKYAFARDLADIFGFPSDHIRPISVEKFPFKATRPKDMSLHSGKVEALGIKMPKVRRGLEQLRRLSEDGWQQDLERALAGDLDVQRPSSNLSARS